MNDRTFAFLAGMSWGMVTAFFVALVLLLGVMLR